MGVLDDLLGELLARSLDSWDERYKRETAAMRTRALASINEHLPLLVGYLRELTDHSDMIRTGRVPLMELGELEGYALPGVRQHLRRVLYLGSDGSFYVFGPADFGRRIDKDAWFDRYDWQRSAGCKIGNCALCQARRRVLLFKWSRHPYFGYYTLPHDRYNYGESLDAALAEAVTDKLQLNVAEAEPVYRKSGMIHIMHGGQQISCMSAHVYEVNPGRVTERTVRNGTLKWRRIDRLLGSEDVMSGVQALLEAIDDSSVAIFDATLTY